MFNSFFHSFFLRLFFCFVMTLLAGSGLLIRSANAASVMSPDFNKTLLDKAMQLPLLRFRYITNYPYMTVGPGLHYLSLIAYLNPAATSSSGVLVVNKIAEDLSNVVKAGNEPELRGIQTSWHDHHLAAAVALAKNNPAIWNQLTDDVKDKLDWIMRIGVYVGNIQHNAANDCYLDMNMKNGGNYNPNQRNAMVAWMSYAFIYFGGTDQVNSVLTSFDYQVLIEKLKEFGWSSILNVMTTPDTERLMREGGNSVASKCFVNSSGVKKAFTFSGRIVTGDPESPNWSTKGSEVPYEPFELLKREEYEFDLAAAVVDKAAEIDSKCGEAGRIRDGFSSPHLGEIGMFLEYNINGRSSPDYVQWGAKNALFHYLTLVVTGYWKSGDSIYDAVSDRFNVAVEVWRYRAEVGWYDTAFCEWRSGISSRNGSDFALDLFDALMRVKSTWIYAPLKSADSPEIVAPTISISIQ